MSCEIIGGIEGGATHSHIVLLSRTGQTLATLNADGTNFLLIGMDECHRRIAELVNKAKKKANVPENTPLRALGLSLSGCESEEANVELANGLRKKYPNLSQECVVGSDTDGSVATTSNRGGIVCIAGTGSNTLLINPDGTKVQCGGWGYLLGDEGSAWSIALASIKICLAALDNFKQPPHPIDRIWQKAQQYFKIKIQPDLLSIFYSKFNKATIAAFCKEVSILANDGDKLGQYIFQQAGSDLARSLAAVIPKASAELVERPGGPMISCVGSVWLSWPLLKPGFVEYLDKETTIKELTLVRVTSHNGLGAAYMACDRLGINVPRDYANNYKAFFEYKRL